MKIYIASSEEHAGNIQEDIYIRDGFVSRNIASEIATLKYITEVTTTQDVVILKSIWGYHKDYKLFLSQISILKERAVRLINDYSFIVWNLDKGKYLAELKSLNVVPTRSLDLKDTQTISEIESRIFANSRAIGVNKLVIKPAISASGHLTAIYDTGRDNNALLLTLNQNKHLNFITQPYRPSVIEGEMSIILINGVALYGIVRFPGVLTTKRPTTYVGLKDIPDSIEETVAKLMQFFLTKFGTHPSICRVDFLENHFGYEILEVELIDPDLFLRHVPGAIREEAISMFYDLIK